MELLTSEETAAYVRAPLATFYRWRSRGQGPRAIRVGKRTLFDRRDVDAWLEQRRENGSAPAPSRNGGRGP